MGCVGAVEKKPATGTAAKETKFKVVLVGEPTIGKTSLISRFVNGSVNLDNVPEIANKTVTVDGKSVTIAVFDTQGTEKFRTITSSFYDSSAGIMIVYDITRPDSFHSLENWFNECERYSPQSEIMLIGNKLDLKDSRAVPMEEAVKLAEGMGKVYVETSATTGEGVEEAFQKLVQSLLGTKKLGGDGEVEESVQQKKKKKKKGKEDEEEEDDE